MEREKDSTSWYEEWYVYKKDGINNGFMPQFISSPHAKYAHPHSGPQYFIPLWALDSSFSCRIFLSKYGLYPEKRLFS